MLCYIDGAPECAHALEVVEWLEWLTDEWHDNQNYKKELSGRLGICVHL
jgi:hypothetical protein